MSNKQPVLSGKKLVKLLEQRGFTVTRVKGSHHRMKHKDGRVTTIPVHKNDDLPKGLLRKIVSEDLGLEMDEFAKLIKTKK
jgi:predicted RNA binding protein YcfA (HicA-like mRNA interferase family)